MDNTNPDRAERRLIYMSSAQLRALKAACKRTGASQAALFRRGLDLAIAEASSSCKRRGAR